MTKDERIALLLMDDAHWKAFKLRAASYYDDILVGPVYAAGPCLYLPLPEYNVLRVVVESVRQADDLSVWVHDVRYG